MKEIVNWNQDMNMRNERVIVKGEKEKEQH